MDIPVPISVPMWRRLMRPSALNSMLAIGASAPVPKSFWQMAKPTPYQLSGSSASKRFLRASRSFDLVGSGLVEDLVQAQGTGRDRALGVLHARAQGVATTQVDGVDAQPASDLVDHHLGRGHGLQGTVAAHRAGLHAARMIAVTARSFCGM